MAESSLTCANCKTPLTVGATSFFVNCPECGQGHTIDRTGPELVARPMGDVPADEPPTPAAAPTEEEEDLGEEVLRVDLAWAAEKKKYLVWGLLGEETEPDIITGALMGFAVAVVGKIVLYQSLGGDLIKLLPGIGLIVAGVALGVYRVQKALAYQQAYRRYQGRRRASTRRPT
jgi:hypothetical protein